MNNKPFHESPLITISSRTPHRMITKAYLDFSNEIKQDEDLTKAFEEILEMLTEINYEEAATILDEFIVH